MDDDYGSEFDYGNEEDGEGIEMDFEGFDLSNMKMNEDGTFSLDISPEQAKKMGLPVEDL